MKKLIIATCIALLPIASFAALTPVADSDLGAVTGQAGVSIAVGGLDLDATIGSVQWTDTDADGGTVSINDIAVNGLTLNPLNTSGVSEVISPLTIDVVNVPAAATELGLDLDIDNGIVDVMVGIDMDLTTPGLSTAERIANCQGIVRIGLPNATLGIESITIDSITVSATGFNTADESFGAVAINDVAVQINSGTVYIFAH